MCILTFTLPWKKVQKSSSKIRQPQYSMLVNRLSTKNHFPRKRLAIDDMEFRVEDLVEVLVFPAKDNCTTGCDILPVQAFADDLTVDSHDISQPKLSDDFAGYEVVFLTSSVEFHLAIDGAVGGPG